MLFGAKINHPSDFLFFLEVEVKTFFWQLHLRVFLVAIGETLAIYPAQLNCCLSLKNQVIIWLKSLVCEITLINTLNIKYFCEYFLPWVLNFLVEQTINQDLQVLKFCIYDNIRIFQVYFA